MKTTPETVPPTPNKPADRLKDRAQLSGLGLYKRIRQHLKDWRCRGCGKLLAKRHRDRFQITSNRTPQYIVEAPIEAVCDLCLTPNRLEGSLADTGDETYVVS